MTPPCAAQPGCRDLTDEPFVRNSKTPEAWLSDIPSAATLWSSVSPRSSAATSAAASGPATEVFWNPREGKPVGEASPRRMRTSQPLAKAPSSASPLARCASPTASAAAAMTALPWAIDAVWVSSNSRLWMSPPLISAASAGAAPAAWPNTVAAPPFATSSARPR